MTFSLVRGQGLAVHCTYRSMRGRSRRLMVRYVGSSQDLLLISYGKRELFCSAIQPSTLRNTPAGLATRVSFICAAGQHTGYSPIVCGSSLLRDSCLRFRQHRSKATSPTEQEGEVRLPPTMTLSLWQLCPLMKHMLMRVMRRRQL